MARTIQPGEMRHTLRFDRRVETDDEAGNVKAGWQPIIPQRRAKCQPMSGGELVKGDRLAGRSAFDIWVRSDAETRRIRPEDRVVDITSDDPTAHRVMNIKFAEVWDEMGFWILIQAEAVRGDDGRV